MIFKADYWPSTRLRRGYKTNVSNVDYYIGQHIDDNGKWRIVKGQNISGELVSIHNTLKEAKEQLIRG